ncbi:MAG TPA: O-succinylhomoserine sulfhydrylase, partial [Acidiferrobacteraceae bacterium]|nr:O-succinylhomoserine sulfhydrylase [Acidiferrobacteraceae bacterium]
MATPDHGKAPEWRAQTIAVRTGTHTTPEGEHSEPIFATSSYLFDSAEQAYARFSGTEPGNIYSRTSNPTVRVFEERLAALEGAERCLATGSGMAAILSVCMGLLRAGDRVVASQSLFGPTIALFQNILTRFGIQFTLVPLADTNAWQQAARGARLLFLETPSNPLTEIGDIAALAEIAHGQGALLAVDNSFCSPILQRPLDLGADLVVHSATKYIDGQGRCLGGGIAGSEQLLKGDLFQFVRTAGPILSPFNAWVFAKGLETLPLRMQAHSAAALALAQWLEQQRRVQRVYYPFLPSHPQYALARAQQSGGGGVLSFEVQGGQEAAWRLINATRLVSITANLGDA